MLPLFIPRGGGFMEEVEKIVMGIVEENLRDYFENEFKIDIKK